jgi:two-component system KDP operon response regulator KdpE
MMTPSTILVVDDEPQIRRVLRTALSAEGYAIVEARDGREALEVLRNERPDLVLMDVNMPEMDGLQACREIRASSRVPMIMLTVRGAEKDKVRALDAGADDYVVKPFGIQELLARIRVALRRSGGGQETGTVTSKELSFDFAKRLILVRGKPVHLTPKEFDLLREMVAHHDTPISHRRLLQAVWGPDYGDETEYLRVVINQLRKKIEPNPAKPKYILTEPWVGYRLVLPPDSRVEESAKGAEA